MGDRTCRPPEPDDHIRNSDLFRRPGGDPMLARTNKQWMLGYFPVVVDGKVFLCTRDGESATGVALTCTHGGKPAWGDKPRIFGDTVDAVSARHLSRGGHGVPRFTMTVAGQRLYARMGFPGHHHNQRELR